MVGGAHLSLRMPCGNPTQLATSSRQALLVGQLGPDEASDDHSIGLEEFRLSESFSDTRRAAHLGQVIESSRFEGSQQA
jgi:hypothetical protein